MSETLRSKLARIEKSLESYEEGQPLPISLSDIFFVIGACSSLLNNIENMEASYKRDMKAASHDVDRFRDKWKESRKICTRLDNERMSLRAVKKEAESLSWWRGSKGLSAALQSYDRSIKKFVD